MDPQSNNPFAPSNQQPFGAQPYGQQPMPYQPPAPQPMGQGQPMPFPTMPESAPAPAPAQDARLQVVERLKSGSNVLVTVSNNPSVDQLAAAIGFTLVLNKLKKHGTAVFSGNTPSTIEFLQPEKTIEKNTDSLRDFIVSLDKAKADKLRYKIEDKYVKIFITPYHTSLGEKDLEFSQGDLNVDVIIALGVDHKDELDQAVTAHGRILHDATVISITKQPSDDIGAINWHVPEASSFSEILVGVSDALKSPNTELFDQQIATAFLTGIVAETDRFKNEKTTPQTMNMAAILMRAGANQQLIADKLEEPEPIPESTDLPMNFDIPASPAPSQMPMPSTVPMPASQPVPAAVPVNPDGSLQIPHEGAPEEGGIPAEDIHIDEDGMLRKLETSAETPAQPAPAPDQSSAMSLPPVVEAHAGQTLEEIERSLNHTDKTLLQLEQDVNSPHLQQASGDVNMAHLTEEEARHNVQALEDAATINNGPTDSPLTPIVALNAMPLPEINHNEQPGGAVPQSDSFSTQPPADPSAPSMPPPMPPPVI